jgi:hypothetical protein
VADGGHLWRARRAETSRTRPGGEAIAVPVESGGIFREKAATILTGITSPEARRTADGETSQSETVQS